VKSHSTTKQPFRQLVLLLCGCLMLFGAQLQAEEVRIGVLAKRGHDKSLEKWNATAEYLNASLPAHHFVITPMAFDDIQVIAKNKMVDFVIVNPGIYVDLSVKYGVRRILTLVNELSEDASLTKFGSVIFTLKNETGIQQLADLKDRRVAAVHQTSLGGWIMALREIRNAGINNWDMASLSFLNTHDGVVEAVLNRSADVGIVRTDTLERMAMEGKLDLSQIRAINAKHYDHFPYEVSTPLYPEWPFAQLSHTSQQLAREVSIALLKLPADHPAAKQAHISGWTIPENYQPVRDLLMLLELPPYERSLRQSIWQSLTTYWYWYLPVMLGLLFLITMSIRIVRLNRSLSEHKMTLKQSQEAQIATFEQAAVGLAHITPTGQLISMNQRLCAITGYPRETLEEMNLKTLIHPEDLSSVTLAFDQLRLQQQSSAAVQFRLRCADGTLTWCQLTVSCKENMGPVAKYFVAVIDDINLYKRLEEETRYAQQQKDLILNIAGDGILGLDSEGKHTFVNPAAAKLLGYTIEEMLNQSSHALWHHSLPDGSAYAEENCPITAVLQHGSTHRGNHETFWKKDRTSIEVECTSTPIFTDGKVTGAVVIFRPTDSFSMHPMEQPE